MSNHENRNWRARWTVDLAARTATHADGWVFRFATAPDEAGGIDGECIAHPPLIGYNTTELPRTASRIAREAGEIYVEALKKSR